MCTQRTCRIIFRILNWEDYGDIKWTGFIYQKIILTPVMLLGSLLCTLHLTGGFPAPNCASAYFTEHFKITLQLQSLADLFVSGAGKIVNKAWKLLRTSSTSRSTTSTCWCATAIKSRAHGPGCGWPCAGARVLQHEDIQQITGWRESIAVVQDIWIFLRNNTRTHNCQCCTHGSYCLF